MKIKSFLFISGGKAAIVFQFEKEIFHQMALEDLVIYTKSRKDFWEKKFGIQAISSKAAFAKMLSAVNGKEIGGAVLDILRMRFGTAGKVIAADGKSIRGTAKSGEPRSALQILSAYVTENGVVLAQEAIYEKTSEIPVFQEMPTYLDVERKTVTADAMHCQRETCRKGIQRKGNGQIPDCREERGMSPQGNGWGLPGSIGK